MAKFVPTDWPLIELARLGPRRKIVDVPIRDVVRADARAFALAGSGGVRWSFDPEWRTTSSTYVTANSDTSAYALDLDNFRPAGVTLRRALGSDGLWLFAADLEQLDLEIKATSTDTGLADTLTLSNTGARDIVGGEIDLGAVSDVFFSLRARATSGTGRLWSAAGCEQILTAAKLPGG